MSRRQDHDLPLSEERLNVKACQVIDWVMHERHIGLPVAQQSRLFTDLTQQNLRWCRSDLTRTGFEEPLQ